MKSSRLLMVGLVVIVPAVHAQDHSTHVHSSNAPVEARSRHIPPDPPQHAMRDMSQEEMNELMDMDDADTYSMLRVDNMEWRNGDDDAFAWDAHAWYGGDYKKAWLKTEGETHAGDTEARIELLWDRVIGRWWSAQAGIRHDINEGPSRSWVAMGVQGLAPYWFEIETTAYLGEQGRTAARFSAEYELLLSQRVVLEPKLDVDIYGQRDLDNGIGSGISSSELALRLRIELRPEFAPYVGVAYTRTYGDTAALRRSLNDDPDELEWLAGVRWWF